MGPQWGYFHAVRPRDNVCRYLSLPSFCFRSCRLIHPYAALVTERIKRNTVTKGSKKRQKSSIATRLMRSIISFNLGFL